MKNLVCLFMLLLLMGCSSNRQLLTEIRDRVGNLPTKEQLFAFQKIFSALDSTIRSTQINVLQYEINKTNSIYDTLRTDDAILKRTNEVLNRLRKPTDRKP